MSDFTIKANTYCPVCRGIVGSDCPHTMSELRNSLSGHTRFAYDALLADRDRLAKDLAETRETRDQLAERISELEDAAEAGGFALGEEIEKLQAELSAARAVLRELRGATSGEGAGHDKAGSD